MSDDDIGRLLRDMAGDGPPDDDLLARVQVGARRATARRRAVVAGAAVLALLGTVGAVTALGPTAPAAKQELVLDDATPLPTSTNPRVDVMEPTGTSEPTTTTSTPAESGRPVPPGMYGGTAVDSQGDPIAGLFVYVLTASRDYRPETRTRADGTFDVRCPGTWPVSLDAYDLSAPQGKRTPSFRQTKAEGTYDPSLGKQARCDGTRLATVVGRGSAVRGWIDTTCTASELGVVLDGSRSFHDPDPEPGEYPWGPSFPEAVVSADGTFRFGGLRPGRWYVVPTLDGRMLTDHGKLVDATPAGTYEVELSVPTSSCPDQPPSPTPTQRPSQAPSASPTPRPTPSPTPSPATS